MKDSRTKSVSTLALRAVVFAWCLFALSMPVTAAVPTDVILVLDNSGSMRKNDPEFLAKSAVSKFVSDLDSATRVGILIFDEKVNYAVPLTELTVATRAAIQNSLGDIDYRGQLTDSPAAIERAIYELKSNAREDVTKVIVFMTDGIVDTGNAEVDTEKTKWMREELAADAADNDIRVFAIAFTENADFFLIQSLAKQTDGEYFRALSPEDLADVFVKLNDKLEAPPVQAVAPPSAPAPAPGPAPIAVPAPVPGAGPCLASLIPDERLAFEEMAVEAGISAEQLCSEMMAAPDGTAVVVRPESEAAPDDTLGMIIVLALGVLVLALVVVVVVVLMRRRKPAAGGAPADDVGAIPEAFIKDIHGFTEDPAVQLGAKPVMIGRVAGNDPEHLDYFVVNKGTIGRRHSMIKYRDFSFWLIDQGSVNGTFLNGERIDGERQLKHGDRIKFHKYEFEFSMPEMDDAGHTVFADPSDFDATMVGEMEPAAALADDSFDVTGGGAAAGVAAAADVFDDEADTALSARAIDNATAALDEDDDDDDFAEMETGIGPAVDLADAGGEEELELVTIMPDAPPPADSALLDDPEPAAPAEDFDAEASAFFGEESFSPAVDADDELSAFDEAPAEPAATPEPADDGEFSESETLLPASMTPDDKLEGTADISLDEFMDTESFQAPLLEADDLEDATLMPEDVVEPPAIEDVFDITAEGEVPPGGTPPPDSGDDDEDDADSESPTIFNR